MEMLAQQASSPYPEFLSFNMIGFFNTKAQKVFSELYCSIDVPLLTAFLNQIKNINNIKWTIISL